MLRLSTTHRGGSFFPIFVGYLKAPAGSPEEAEARGKLEADLQAINDYLAKQVCSSHTLPLSRWGTEYANNVTL